MPRHRVAGVVQQAERGPDAVIPGPIRELLEARDPDLEAIAPPRLGRQTGRAVERSDPETLPGRRPFRRMSYLS